MSAGDRAAAAAVMQVAMVGDGAVLGLALAYVSLRSIVKFAATSSALRRISDAPSVRIADLRSLINDESGDGNGGEGFGRLVVVRGTVEPKSGSNGSGEKNLWSEVFVSHDSGQLAVVLEESQKYIYNEWRGVFGCAILTRAWRDQRSTSIKAVPFVLVDNHRRSQPDYVSVDLKGSNHPLPLTTAFHQMLPMQASPFTFLHALFGHAHPVGLLYEGKLLAPGKDVTAVGICSSRDGTPEIKSCRELAFFLSKMTKDQMVLKLSSEAKFLLWRGIIVGSVAIGILGYAIWRNWNKWKEWRERRRTQQEINDAAAAIDSEASELEGVEEDDEVAGVPDGRLCVICLMKRRRSAFVPCGHLVCCQRCALFVERDLAPKCPVCRQPIRTSLRIFDS